MICHIHFYCTDSWLATAAHSNLSCCQREDIDTWIKLLTLNNIMSYGLNGCANTHIHKMKTRESATNLYRLMNFTGDAMTYECGVILPNGDNFWFVFIASALFYISYRIVPATPNDQILYCVCYDRVTSACPCVSKIQIYTSYTYRCWRQCDEIKKNRILYLHLTR